jgi:hypothetical protein
MTRRSDTVEPNGLCIAHPIRVARSDSAPPHEGGLMATVECEVRGRSMAVTHCQQCERFKRVEVHEGAYVLLCRT